MIYTNNATTKTIDPRQQRLDAIENIENIVDDATRWRAIQQFMFKISPHLVAEDRVHCAAVAEVRSEQLNDLGATKKGHMRQLYSMPEYLYRALQAMDPNFRKYQSGSEPLRAKKYNHKIWKVFPEYRIARKI